MPKTIELTVEIDVQRVSCPGVWLCQDGRVSLNVYALGTSYQTCLLPPTFPLLFKDVFYFRKRFQESCALNNICCLLKDESIYCELLQWCENNGSGECEILAQYLGALNNVLFPPNMCSNDGVDLLMRRSKEFPGILSPKIEIATKVRIDEVWNQPSNVETVLKENDCLCPPSPPREDSQRQTLQQQQAWQAQQQACHTAKYHRYCGYCAVARKKSCIEKIRDCIGRLFACKTLRKKCSKRRPPSGTRAKSRSRSRSESTCSRSVCSLKKNAEHKSNCSCPIQKPCLVPPCVPPPRSKKPSGPPPRREFYVYNVQTPRKANECANQHAEIDDRSLENSEELYTCGLDSGATAKTVLESRYIEQDKGTCTGTQKRMGKRYLPKIIPCTCEICKRYHELFHMKNKE